VSLTGAAESRFPSPGAYTPRHLAEKILTSKSALEGERKQVTVLFADLKGSMELLADRDPEDARKLLDPVLERMMEAVHRYEGTVNQVMGDGIMALFGAPLAHEDHAVRACYAALAMQESVKRYAEELRRTGGVALAIRIGVNSGEVVVRSIGSDLHMDYTAVGQTSHLAARMEQAAWPGSIVITPDTLRLAEGYIDVKPLGAAAIKGLPEPVDVYELTGASAARTRLQALAARGLTSFVGREAELEQLRLALERAGRGQGQVIAVLGEPGIGKSRLFYEFTRSHRTHGWLILESRAVSYGMATAYLPVVDMLRTYFKVQGRDDHREIREKVTGKLLTLDRVLEPTIPAFLSLLDVSVDDATWQLLDPPQRRQRTLDAARRLLLRESQVQPLLLVFEDLHWIDSETQALLEAMVESLPAARVLLLMNYRPEYRHGWGGKTYYRQLQIDPLPSEGAAELLNALLGGDSGLEPLKRLLIERTEGNPFFMEESVRTLVETQALAGARGAYRVVKDVASLQVAPTVQAVLAARIDRLPPDDKRLLQCGAVIGKDVPLNLLEAIADLTEPELRSGLARLQAGEFLYETRLFPDLEYTFKHALTHEVAYGALLGEQRRGLHAKIVEAIERLYAGREVEQVDRLAHHAARAELWERSARYSRHSGTKAFARAANLEAVRCFEETLAALRRLPDTPETIAQAIDVRLDLRTALLALGLLEDVLVCLREAENLVRRLPDERRKGRVWALLANAHALLGEHEQAISRGNDAISIAQALGDLRLERVANIFVGQASFYLGDLNRATYYLRHSLRLMEREPSRERVGMAGVPVVARAWLAWTLSHLGEFAEAVAVGEEALRVADSLAGPGSSIVACLGVAFVYVSKGEYERGITVAERGLRLCSELNFPGLAPILAAQLGYAYALVGRTDEGIRLLETAVTAAESRHILGFQSVRTTFLAEAHLAAGQIGQALAAARRALELSRRHRERVVEGSAERVLGDIAARREPLHAEEAEQHYRRALAVASATGARPEAARGYLGLGLLHRRLGHRQQARDHLDRAATMYREMDMRFWLDQAETEDQAL
jgi:class 3 adenylate cyclase/tetratricopeptide (TPR) repeat protein